MDGGQNQQARGLLSGSPLFDALPADLRSSLAAATTLHQIDAGDVLFDQGDDADAAYVVVSGRFEAIHENEGVRTVVRELASGDTAGELALLTGGQRSATVRAIRDSTVLRLGSREFIELISTEATFALSVARALANQVQTGTDLRGTAGRVPSVVALVGVPGVPLDLIGRSLTEAVRAHRSATLLVPSTDADWSGRVETAERNGELVLLAASFDRSDWDRFCVREADRIVLVADPRTAPRGLLQDVAGADLALLGRGSEAASWVKAVTPARRYMVDVESAASFARLARRLCGRAVGVALSGGGARGLAHVGVLQVLDERGISVDRVGGTSIGAFLGSMFAVGFPPSQMAEICRSELALRNAFDDYTIPRVSLIRAQKARRMLDRVFGALRFEDLERDLFVTSADLTSGELVLHRTGPLVDAIGASMSLPGFAPPVRMGDRVLVDGGVLDNLPVGPMLDASEGPVIAVDVMGRWDHDTDGGRAPRIIETLARATVLGSWSRAQRDVTRAALTIAPETSGTRMFDFGRLDALVRAGRDAAEIALDGLDQPLV